MVNIKQWVYSNLTLHVVISIDLRALRLEYSFQSVTDLIHIKAIIYFAFQHLCGVRMV